MNKLFPLVWVMLISGCGGHYIQGEQGDWIPIGSDGHVEVKQAITIPAGRARVFLQRGVPIPLGALDSYDTSCSFELRELAGSETRIPPGRFLIENVEIGSEPVVRIADVRMASLTLRGLQDPGPSIYRFYRFRLFSPGLPELLSLTCRGALADQPESRLPTLAEIRQALGTVVELHLNLE